MHIKIVQDNETVVDLPDWGSEIPRTGDYIFHPPPLGSSHPRLMDRIAGCVKVVVWRTHDRTEDGFVQAADPYVEITI